ncbi:MAG: hypothetical protein IJG13_00275 [Kiritimatiellae bacterium]|nr:hypothetical protein [Kiritimatiellia bacterium]
MKWDAPLKERALAAEDTNCEIVPGGEGVKIEDGEVPALLSDGYSISRFEGGKPVLQNDVLFKSGNIYRKIDAMAALKAENPEYAAQIDRQIAALEAVKPTPRTFEEIKFNGLEGWHGEEPGWAAKALKKVGVEIVSAVDEEGKVTYSVRPVSDRILSSKDAELLGKFINGEKLVKQGKDQTLDSHIKELQDAELHVAEIYAGLRGLINGNEAAREIVERGANEAMNAYVPPDYTKLNHLSQKTFDKFKANGIKLRPNQVNWATKAFIEGRGLNAHDVGGGKTLGALALTDMLLDHGSAKKILISVPKQTFNKWVADARKVMPDRTVIDASGLSHGKTRGKVLAQIANADTQIVFTTHEGMGCIELSPEDEAVAMETYLREVSESGDRQGAKMADKLLAYMEQEAKRKRETRWTMDKLGIDCMIADEAHNFKNVGVSMSSGAVGKPLSVKGGVNQRTGEVKPYSIDSARSTDFRYKCDYITSHNNDRNVFLLTATPTPNSPLEIYTMLRHMGANPLAEYGIFNDRDFRRTFMRIAHRMTVQTDGSRAMEKALVKLTNVYALRDLMNRFIDRIPMSVFASELGIPLPETRERHAFVRMSDGMRQIVEDCKQRMENLPPEIRKGDDTLIAIYMDGLRAAAAEMGYEGPHAGVTVDARTFDSDTDKLEWAADYATKIVREGNKSGGVPQNVILFCNTMAKKRMDRGGLSIHEEIKQALLARGFKPEEVIIGTGALMTDPATGKETTRITDDLKYQITQAFAPEDKSVKTPTARVIIASKIFSEGMNLQRFARAVVHIDQPLTNGEVIQRDGRAVRSGNEHREVDIVHLFRTGSYDQLAFGLASTKKGWNEALWDKAAADELDVSEEFTGGAVPSAKQLEIEMIEDPVEKIRRRVEYQLEALRERHVSQIGAVSSAKESVVSNKMAIEERRRNADTFSAKASEAKIEKAKLEGETLPAAKKTAETSRGTFLELAKLENVPDAQAKEVADRISALPELREKVLAAEDKAFEVSQRKPDGMSDEEHVKAVGDAQAALAEERKAFGEYGKELTVLVNELPESVRATARSMRDKYEAVGKVLTEIRNSGDVIASNTRRAQKERDYIPSLEEYGKKLDERVAAEEQTLADVVAEAEAVRSHWYTKSGENGPEVFNVETASLQAEIEAGNKKEDADMDWVGTRQTLDMMPAPAATGTRKLNKGKLPQAAPLEATGTAKPKYTTSPADIFRTARELFPELRITNKGTYHRRGVLGWLEVENRVIRTIDPRAVGVLSHELGHAVSRLAENKVKMPRDARNEFISLGIDLYGGKRPAGGYATEGFAEFVRGFLCDYDLAKDYPNAHKWFFEDFGEANPEYMKRLAVLKGKIYEYTSSAPEQALRSMWNHKEPMSQSWLRWIANKTRYFTDGRFRTDWFDSNQPIIDLQRRLGMSFEWGYKNKTPAERAALLLNNPYNLATFYQGKAWHFAEIAALHKTVDLYGNETGAGLRESLLPITTQGQEHFNEFIDFAVAKMGALYHKRGLEFGRSRNEVAATLKKYRSPEFVQGVQAITDWSHRLLHLLVDAGAITGKQYQDICDANPVYITMSRIFEEGEIDRLRMKSGKRAIFNRRGGTQDIEHPIVALCEMAARVIANAHQAKIVSSLVDMYDRAKADKNPYLNKFMVEVPNPVKREVVWADKIKEQIASIARARLGTDEATIRAALQGTWTEELSVFSTGKYTGKDNIVTITDKSGNLRSFEVANPAILNLLRGYSTQKPSRGGIVEGIDKFFGRPARLAVRLRRAGSTVYNTAFTLANVVRDAGTSFLSNEYGTPIPVIDTFMGAIDSILRTDIYKKFTLAGGGMGRFYDGNPRATAKSLADQVMAANPAIRAWKRGLMTMLGDIISQPEIWNRISPARRSYNCAMSEGLGEQAAKFLCRITGDESTSNFGRAGNISRIVNQYIPFFNAFVRGWDQVAQVSGINKPLPWQKLEGDLDMTIDDPFEREREYTKRARWAKARRFTSRALILMALSLISHSRRKEDKEEYRRWKELKPHEKWNNIIIGDAKIPIPYEPGYLFAMLPVAISEATEDGDMKPVNEVLKQIYQSSPIQIHDLHAIVASIPLLSAAADIGWNKKFNDQPVVPKRLQHFDPRDQYDERTTAFAKAFGEMTNISPMEIDHFINAQSGGFVGNLLRDVEALTAKRGALGVNGDWSMLSLTRRFVLSPYASSRLPGDFYDELQTLTAKHNSGRTTPEELGKLKAMEDVNEKVLSENSKMRRAVLAREDISAEEAKKMADNFLKNSIDTIRDFNGDAKEHNFRDEGIRAAVATLSNPAATDSSIQRDRKILAGIELFEAQQALRVYGRSKGWSRSTINKRLRFLTQRW